jgi:SAM-dependent methyltransferase
MHTENRSQTIKSGDDTYSSAMASAHRYMDWMLTPFKPYLHGDIVEVGIGHGGYYTYLSKYGSYLGLDIDERSIAAARQQYPAGNFAFADILHPEFLSDFLPNKADAVVCLNVLEHIGDDKTAIRNMIGALKPNGTLLICVPALMTLYNDLDRLAGHQRRYSISSLGSLFVDLPVKVAELSYFNPIGGIGWWANRFRRHESLNSELVNGQIVLFEKFVLPFSRALDPLTRRFFGQSLLCIARRI